MNPSKEKMIPVWRTRTEYQRYKKSLHDLWRLSDGVKYF
jgi:hypothetical protein